MLFLWCVFADICIEIRLHPILMMTFVQNRILWGISF